MSIDERNPLRQRPRYPQVQQNPTIYPSKQPILPEIEEEKPLTAREMQMQTIKEQNEALIADRLAKALQWVRES